MSANQGPDFEVITKLGENDGGHTACFMAVEIETNIPPVGELPPETRKMGCRLRMLTAHGTFSKKMVTYDEGRDLVRIADDRAMSIEGIWNLPMSLLVW